MKTEAASEDNGLVEKLIVLMGLGDIFDEARRMTKRQVRRAATHAYWRAVTPSPQKKDLKNRVYNYKYELLDLSIRAIQLLDSSYYFYDRFAQLFPSPSVNVVQLQRGGFIFSFFGGREITRHAFSFGNIDDNHWTAAHSCCVLCRSYRAAMRRMNHSLWSWHLKVAVHTTLHCTIIFVSFFLNIVPPEDVLNTHQESHNQHVVLAFAAPLYIYTYLACTYAKAHKLFCIYIYIC